MSTISLNNKKVINAWALFDWANSAYALVISTAIFPGYFEDYTPSIIKIGNYDFSNSAIYSFAVSLSYILIALASPILSGIADFSGRRMFFLRMFTLVGSFFCSVLFFFENDSQLWLATSAFVLATIGYAGSLVFYDSYLPIIASKDQYNKVSAKGYTYGYIGSVLLLIFILAMILRPHIFGFENGQTGARVGFLLVGFWWFGFSQYTFRHLPKDLKGKFDNHLLLNGYKELSVTWGKIKDYKHTKRFLISFFFYMAGVQTVIYLATLFAKVELNFEIGELILLVLILQIIAIGGAYLFSIIGDRIGNKKSIMIMIMIWVIICVGAFFTTGKLYFYGLAGLVGMVMGGIQSLSRSTYSMLLPKEEKDITSFFSLYDVIYKLAIVCGTFIFGIVDNMTGNMRYSVLVLGLLFVIGLIFISITNIITPITKKTSL